MLTFYTLNFFVNFLSSAILGFFVISRNRNDIKNITFFVLAIFASFWSLSHYFLAISTTEYWALFWSRADLAFIFFLPSSYLHFAYAFTEKSKSGKRLVILAYICSFIFFILNFSSLFVNQVKPLLDFRFWPVAEPALSFAVIPLYSLCIFYSSFLLLKGYRSAVGIVKLQTKYAATGLVISFFAGSLNFVLWYQIPLPPFANLLVPVYVVLISYAITRYRLMDIRVITKQVLFYGGFSFFFFLLFNLISWMNVVLFGNVFSSHAFILEIFIVPLATIIMYNGSGYFSRFINKHLFPTLYNYQNALNASSETLSRYVDFEEIVKSVIETIKGNLNPSSIGFLKSCAKVSKISEELKISEGFGFGKKNNLCSLFNCVFLSNYFKKNKILVREELDDLLQEKKLTAREKTEVFDVKNKFNKLGIFLGLPIMSRAELVGVIVLGSKSDADSYTHEDFVFLETLSHQAQIAISNALLYREVEAKNENLQELLNAKDEFMRIVNHQLNTPISIMRNAYSMVKDGSLSCNDAVNYFGNGLDRLSRVSQSFWNVIQNKEEIITNIQENDILQIVKDVVKDRKKVALDLGKAIKISIEKSKFNVPRVFCDAKQISNIIGNLLENAIFYTSKGGVKINFELLREGTILKINVKDSGIGFSIEEAKSIGTKFFRSKSAPLNHPDGSGLGLYICKKLVENNKGELTFDSKGKNLGSTFSFTLPAAVTTKI